MEGTFSKHICDTHETREEAIMKHEKKHSQNIQETIIKHTGNAQKIYIDTQEIYSNHS